jgi:hypothetical protein
VNCALELGTEGMQDFFDILHAAGNGRKKLRGAGHQ